MLALFPSNKCHWHGAFSQKNLLQSNCNVNTSLSNFVNIPYSRAWQHTACKPGRGSPHWGPAARSCAEARNLPAVPTLLLLRPALPAPVRHGGAEQF